MSEMSGRRGLATAVVGVLVVAGLVLLGASRVWWREVVSQPAPLRAEEILHTGASLAPVLPALGFVALAGAGGVLATRGLARRLVGGLLGAAGVAKVVLVIGHLGSTLWPLVCLAGGLLVGAGGVLAVRYGDRWPAMGRRYDRGSEAGADPRVSAKSARESTEDIQISTAEPGGLARAMILDPASGARTDMAATDSAALWEALDRGDDPTR